MAPQNYPITMVVRHDERLKDEAAELVFLVDNQEFPSGLKGKDPADVVRKMTRDGASLGGK